LPDHGADRGEEVWVPRSGVELSGCRKSCGNHPRGRLALSCRKRTGFGENGEGVSSSAARWRGPVGRVRVHYSRARGSRQSRPKIPQEMTSPRILWSARHEAEESAAEMDEHAGRRVAARHVEGTCWERTSAEGRQGEAHRTGTRLRSTPTCGGGPLVPDKPADLLFGLSSPLACTGMRASAIMQGFCDQ